MIMLEGYALALLFTLGITALLIASNDSEG